MADLNSLIAQGTQFQAPVDPFANYAKMQQLEQGQQANQLAQMQMQKYRQDMTLHNAMRALDPNSPTYIEDIKRIDPEKGFAFAKLQQESRNAGTEGELKRTKLLADKLSMLPEAYRMADTPAAFLQVHQSVHSDPVIGPWLTSMGATPEKGMAQFQEAVQTGTFQDLRAKSMQSVSQLVDSMKPMSVTAGSSVYDPRTKTFTQSPERADTDLIRNYNAAKAQGFAGSIFDYERKIKEAGRTPAAPAAAQPPVAVVDPVTGKQVYVSREEALKGRMTPASNATEKPMTALQQQTYKKDFANDSAKVKSAITTADELEKLTDELVGNPDKKLPPHPGLSGITGYSGIFPSLPSGQSAKAEQKLDTFKGKIKALGRTIASQEGKLGNMAVQEWQMVSDAVQAIKPTADNLDEQMRDVVRQARNLARNVQDKFDLTYEGYNQASKSPSSTAPATTKSGSTVSNW